MNNKGAMKEEQQSPDPTDDSAAEQAAPERHYQDQHSDERADAQDVVGGRRVEAEVG